MKKHYLVSLVMVPLGIYLTLTAGHNTTTYLALTLVFIAYPFIIDKFNKDYEEYEGTTTDNAG